MLVLFLLRAIGLNRNRRNSLTSFHINNWKACIKTIGACIVAFGSASTSASVVTYGGAEFSSTNIDFADIMVSYNPLPDVNGDLPNTGSNDPNAALGAADYVTSGPYYVSLGVGGSLTLGFSGKYLTGSGNVENDLWIFEIGTPEAVTVSISKDGNNWFNLGQVKAIPNVAAIGIDIDSFGYGLDQFFSYVRLTDVANDAETLCSTGSSYCFVGADIDAVGITSVTSVPVPATIWLFGSVLSGIGLFGKGKRHVSAA